MKYAQIIFLPAGRRILWTVLLLLAGGLWAQQDTTFLADDDDMTQALIVRSIKSEVISQGNNSVRISWIPAGGGGEYIVARSTIPIDSLAVMKKSQAVGVLPSAESSIIDSGLSQGTYYYAVGLRAQIADGTLALVAGQNYTTQPVVLGAATAPQSKETPPPVSLIFAALIQKKVLQVTWRGIRDSRVIYTVYRSDQVINDAQSLAKARKMAEIVNGSEYYVDDKLGTQLRFYYAVTTRYKGGVENKKLLAEQNFTRDPVELEFEGAANITRFITAQKKGAEVRIDWKDAKNKDVKGYRLYRAGGIINTPTRLKSAKQIAELKPGTQTYLDKEPGPGTNYYAILSVYKGGGIEKALVIGKNFTDKPAKFKGKAATKQDFGAIKLQALRTKTSDGKIRIQWKLNSEGSDKFSVRIFRADKPIKNKDRFKDAKKLGSVSGMEPSYIDIGAKPGEDYYYAAAIVDNKGQLVEQPMKAGVNFTEEPVKLPKADVVVTEPVAEPEIGEIVDIKDITRSDVQKVLISDFKEGKYKKTVDRLNEMLSSGNITPEAASLARLYIGIAVYRLGQPRQAIKYFLHPDVKKTYGKRADFYYRRSLDRLRP